MIAGQKIDVPIKVSDRDITGSSQSPQKLTLRPKGVLLSKSKRSSIPPKMTHIRGKQVDLSPAAFLKNKAPVFDQSLSRPEAVLEGLGSINSRFIWQTDCNHINHKKGDAGKREALYRFSFNVQDDHCPTPLHNSSSMLVKLSDPEPLGPPIMKGVSVDLEGKLSYQWSPPIDTLNTFQYYKLEGIAVYEGKQPTGYNTINKQIPFLASAFKDKDYFVHVPSQNRAVDLLNKLPNRDWYFRMITSSSCIQDTYTEPSQTARIMEVDLTPVGERNRPKRSKVSVRWNPPTTAGKSAYSYNYESKTHYYIWENDSIVNGGVNQANNWYLRGDTVGSTEYRLPANVCSDYIGIRIEARDTVIVPLKSPNGTDSNVTYTYSTFSLIDTIYMEDDGFIPVPRFDTLEILSNGSIALSLDQRNVGTKAKVDLFMQNLGRDSLIQTMENFTEGRFLVPAQSKQTIQQFKLRAHDKCKGGSQKESPYYSTISLQGQLEQPLCNSTLQLSWNVPKGFSHGVKEFSVFMDSIGGDFKLLGTIDSTKLPRYSVRVHKNTKPIFKVIAYGVDGEVNISVPFQFSVPKDLRSFEVVSAPDLRCTKILDNGHVILSFVSPVDSTNNGIDYELDYKTETSDWMNYLNSSQQRGLSYNGQIDPKSLDSIYIEGINAQEEIVHFRMRSRSGCYSNEFSPYNFIQTVYLIASANPFDESKKVQIQWNTPQVSKSQVAKVELFKSDASSPVQYNEFNIFTEFISNHHYFDTTNYSLQGEMLNYYTKTHDSINACFSRSSIDSVWIELKERPERIPKLYIPNAFAPQGVNRVFKPKSIFIDKQDYKMQILWRSGEVIFESRDLNKGWNGTIKGKDAPMGNYFYIISYKDIFGNAKLRKGNFALLR